MTEMYVECRGATIAFWNIFQKRVVESLFFYHQLNSDGSYVFLQWLQTFKVALNPLC